MGKKPNQYTKKQRFLQAFLLFLIGGVIYVGIELAWRGYSHISMFFLGGICFVMIGYLNESMKVRNWRLFKQMLIGGICIITPLEFITGYIVNIKMGLEVWDYSELPCNIMGQICPLFSIIWCLLSLVCILLDDWMRHKLFDQDYPEYHF